MKGVMLWEQLKFYGRIIKYKLKINKIDKNLIPKETYYCEDCPYWDANPMAPRQAFGYCHYVGAGDSKPRLWGLWWSRGTDLLWDGIKECDVEK